MSFESKLIFEVRNRPILWDKHNDDYKNRLKSDKEWSIVAENLNKTKANIKSKWKNLRDVFLKEARKIHRLKSGDPGSSYNEDIYIGKWSYFKEMTFLIDIVKPKAAQINYEDSDARSEDNEIQYQYSENSEAVGLTEAVQNREPAQFNYDRSFKIEPGDNLNSRKRVFGLDEDASDSSSRASEVNQIIKRKVKKQELSHFEQKMIEIEKLKMQALNSKKDDEDMLFLRSLAPYFKYLTPVQKLRLKSKIQNCIADEISMSTPATSYTP